MELVAWLAGEPHSDEPRCACPVLTALVRAANDLMPDELREVLLRPLAARLVQSRADATTTERRAWIAADRAVRVFGVLALERSGNGQGAAALRRLPAIDSPARAALSAAHLARWERPCRATLWTLRQAASGRPAAQWITGLAHAARETGAWGEIPRLVESMLASPIEAPGPID